MKRIIIGGSGSSGSSLLKNILARHSEIFAGNETNLFCKRALFDDFNKYKSRILKKGIRGLTNHGFHHYRKIDLLSNEYLHTRNGIMEMIEKSHSFQIFSDEFYGSALHVHEKTHWLEKTPSNAYNFLPFLTLFENTYAIHIVRNPYDTIASLINRGFSAYYAAAMYFLNNATGHLAANNTGYHRISYENLTTAPEATIKSLCHKLDIPYEDEMLQPTESGMDATQNIDSWNYREHHSIHPSADTYNELSDSTKQQVHGAIHHLILTTQGKRMYQLNVSSLLEQIDQLGYALKEAGKMDPILIDQLTKEKNHDLMRRLSKGYLKYFFNYPLDIYRNGKG